MSKLSLSSILSGFRSLQQLNANFAAIVAAFDNTLSRDGTSPNSMGSDLDMNSYNIINLPDAVQTTEPVTLGQFSSALAGLVPYPPLNAAPAHPIIGQGYWNLITQQPYIYGQDGQWHGVLLS